MDRYTQGTLVTANARLSRQLRRDYDADRRRRGVRAWESPDILPRGAWLARLWQKCAARDPFGTPVLLSPLQEQVLWEQAIAASDVTGVLLDLPATIATAAQAWNLARTWGVGCEASEFEGLSDPEAFLGWMRAVERKLRENDWITASELPQALLNRVHQGTLVPGVVFHAGFDELAPADRSLFEACHAQPWPIDPAEPSRRSRVAFRDVSEELIHAAAWARRTLEAKPDAKIGVVVPGLAGLSVAVERIFDDTFHPSLDFVRPAASDAAFHISSGVRCADIPMIGVALLTLGLKPGLQIGEAGLLLRSPFLRLDKLPASRAYADLRRQGVETISFEIEAVRRVFPAMAKAADALRERQHPSEWSATFSKLLDGAGWPGDRTLSPVEQQTVEHWKTLLSQMASLDIVLPRLNYSQALERLRRIAYDERFSARDEAAPVQVMDLPEAAGSHFDALWIAALHAGVWPELPRLNPFLPSALQRAAGMPHSSPERELNCARSVTARLLASAPEVVWSYPLFSGEEKLRISPLIETLPEALPEETNFVAPFETPLRKIFLAWVPLNRQPMGQAPPVLPVTLQRGGMQVLADQAWCPFRAFAIHRLGAREYNDPDIGISPSERGTVAHQALEHFWREIGSQRELALMSAAEVANVIETSVSTALDSRLSRRHKNASLERSRVLEHSRLTSLLEEWLHLERARLDFTVVERETPRRINAGGLELELKVDRIDQQVADGTHVILDYKTSDNLSIKNWDGDRPDAPQLPLYAVKSERIVSGVYFAKLVPGQTALLGHAGRELEQRLPEWSKVVDQLGANFLAGDATVDPKNATKTCALCDLHSLCRIGDFRRADEAGE